MIDLNLKNACHLWLQTRVLFCEKGGSQWQRLFKFLRMFILQFFGLDILEVHRTTEYDVLVVRNKSWGSRGWSVSNAIVD